MSLLIPLLLTLSIFEVSLIRNYYWRRFHGTVPFDAVLWNLENKSAIYIGRAAFERKGLLLVRITEYFNRTATVTIGSDKAVHCPVEFTEILCSPRPHTAFEWVVLNYRNQTGLVEGGYESISGGINNGVLHIGLHNRFSRDGTLQIGKVIQNINGEKETHLYYINVLKYVDRNETSDNINLSSARNILSIDYYWRKYSGEVPHDAVVATPDDQVPIYIGRAPFEHKGLLVGPILKGDRYVTVTHGSEINDRQVHHVDEFVEILCSPTPNRFSWVRTTAEDLLGHRGLVEGGFQSFSGKKNGDLYIGRTLNWDPQIGKVIGYHNTEQYWNKLYYAGGDEEAMADYYEVLRYSEL